MQPDTQSPHTVEQVTEAEKIIAFDKEDEIRLGLGLNTMREDALERARYLDGYADIIAKEMYRGERPSGIWNLERAAELLRRQVDLIDALRSRLTTAARQPEAQGWIVGNGKGDRWRTWAAIGPVWTDDPAKATRYARREDAEAVHAEDEDAWLVVPYPGQPSAPSQDALREALQRIADMWPSSFTDMNAPLGLARAMAAIATAALQQGASKHAE